MKYIITITTRVTKLTATRVKKATTISWINSFDYKNIKAYEINGNNDNNKFDDDQENVNNYFFFKNSILYFLLLFYFCQSFDYGDAGAPLLVEQSTRGLISIGLYRSLLANH